MTEEALFDESATPSQNPDVDINSVSEKPTSDEFFLYSRIDGSQTVEELCRTSGLGRKKTLQGLRQLLEVGLIEIPGATLESESSSELSSVSSSPVVDESEDAGEESEVEEDSPTLGSALGAADSEPEDKSAIPLTSGPAAENEDRASATEETGEMEAFAPDPDGDGIEAEETDAIEPEGDEARDSGLGASSMGESSTPESESEETGGEDSGADEVSGDEVSGDESSVGASEDETQSEAAEEDADESNAAEAESDESKETHKKPGGTGIDLSHLPIPPEAFDIAEELLELDVPVNEELKRELIVLYEQIDELTHYEFFGVERDADQRDIKKSYFKLSKRYHPDKHFRKDIGPYKEMLEDIFQKITRAYRTLSNDDKRREYNQELAAREDDSATPMSRPTKVNMAEETSTGDGGGKGGGKKNKRTAAFAQLVKKGEKARKHGNFIRAAECYRKALSLKRDLKVAIQATRVLLKANAQLDQAELFAQAALRIDDQNVTARMLLARVYERQEKIDRAVEQYDRVLEVEPGHDRASTRRKQLIGS